MKNIYDELYRDSDYYGHARPEVLDWLDHFPQGSKLLDVGCGQGRYAIPLAEMGFKVTAIDNSTRAISQLKEKIKRTGLKINAFLSDAYLFEDYRDYDVLFFNLFFHFNPHELSREKDFLIRIAQNQKLGSRLGIVGYTNFEDLELIKTIFTESYGYQIQTASHYFLLSMQKISESPEV